MKASASSSRYNGARKAVEEPSSKASGAVLLGQFLEVSEGCEDSVLIGSQLLNVVTPGLVGNSVPLSRLYPIQALSTGCSE